MPRDEFKGKSRAGNYGDFVVETDWSIGQIVEEISKNGLTDNTLLIITSDNGAHSEPLHLGVPHARLRLKLGERPRKIGHGRQRSARQNGSVDRDLVLGLDLGTTRSKVLLLDATGAEVAVAVTPTPFRASDGRIEASTERCG